MFARISFTGLAKSPLFGYAKELPFFKKRRHLDFKPGLNLLVGPNGSGKSTVLKILGETLCATQGGVSTVTEGTVHQTVDMSAAMRGQREKVEGISPGDKIRLKVDHDGQPVIFFDPRQAVGLTGGAFDDDFFSMGMSEIMASKRASHGQLSAHRGDQALAVLLGKAPFPEKINRRMTPDRVNDVWKCALEVIEARLAASIDLGQPTLLLDEPEANYSLVWQARLWTLLSRPDLASKFQIIVATHSAFALGIDHANYIEVVPGFREEAESALRARFSLNL